MAFKRIKDWATSITAFRTGDVIPVDGPSGTAKMGKDDLLARIAENTLGSIHSLSDTKTDGYLAVDNATSGVGKMNTSIIFENFAPKFIPSSEPNPTTTVAGQPYMYNGSLYVAKEVYQGPWVASKFVKLPISEIFAKANVVNFLKTKSDFLEPGANLFNQDDTEDGVYLDANGVESNHASYSVSGFIQVEPSNDYYICRGTDFAVSSNSNIKFCYYDKNFMFLGSESSTAKAISTPASCYYVRVSLLTAIKSTTQMKKGDSYTEWTPYCPIDGTLDNSSLSMDLVNDFIYNKILPVVFDVEFVWNVSPESVTWTNGQYYSIDGSIGNSANYSISNKISVKGQRYIKYVSPNNIAAGQNVASRLYDKYGRVTYLKLNKTPEIIQLPYGTEYVELTTRNQSADLYFYDSLMYSPKPAVITEEQAAGMESQTATYDITWNVSPESINFESNYYYSLNDGEKVAYTGEYIASEKIDVHSVKFVKVYPVPVIANSNVGYTFYNENNVYLGGVQPASYPDGVIKIPYGTYYMGVTGVNTPPSIYFPSSITTNYNKVDNLEQLVKANTPYQKNAIRIYPATQMGAFAFTWDDGVAKDDDVYTFFKARNAKCGFALDCSSGFITGRAGKYRYYQKEGFSCLNHTGTNLSTYADEAAAQAVVAAGKMAMENFGIMINGWVCPGNNYVTAYRSMLGKFHGYAFGDHGNGEGTNVYDVNTHSQDTLRLRRWDIEDSSVTTETVKSLIDDACTNGYLVVFYGHAARIGTTGYHDMEWYDEIITYIETKQSNGLCFFGSPDECVQYYFGL